MANVASRPPIQPLPPSRGVTKPHFRNNAHRRSSPQERAIARYRPVYESNIDSAGNHVVSVKVQGKRWRRKRNTYDSARIAAIEVALGELQGGSHRPVSFPVQNANRFHSRMHNDKQQQHHVQNSNQPDDDLYNVPTRPSVQEQPVIDETVRRTERRVELSDDDGPSVETRDLSECETVRRSSKAEVPPSSRRKGPSRFSDIGKKAPKHVPRRSHPSSINVTDDLPTPPRRPKSSGIVQNNDITTTRRNTDPSPSNQNEDLSGFRTPPRERREDRTPSSTRTEVISPLRVRNSLPEYRGPLPYDSRRTYSNNVPRRNADPYRRENVRRRENTSRRIQGPPRPVQLAPYSRNNRVHGRRSASHHPRSRSPPPWSGNLSDLPRPSRRHASLHRNTQYETPQRRSQSPPGHSPNTSGYARRTHPPGHENLEANACAPKTNRHDSGEAHNESPIPSNRNNERHSTSSSGDGRRPSRSASFTSQRDNVQAPKTLTTRSSSSSGSGSKRRKVANSERCSKRRKSNNEPPSKQSSEQSVKKEAKAGDKVGDESQPTDAAESSCEEWKKKLEEFKKEQKGQKSIDFVSLVNMAYSRHTADFIDLKNDSVKPKPGFGDHMHRHMFELWTRDENGDKGKKLHVIGAASKIKEAKQAAAGKLLEEMLKVNPELKWGHGKYKKVKKGENAASAGIAFGKSPKSVLEELKSAMLFEGNPEYTANSVTAEQTEDEPDPKPVWEVTCTVLFKEPRVDITKSAANSKKKEAEHMAAQKAIDEIVELGNETALRIIHKVPKRKEEVPKAPDCKALGEESESDDVGDDLAYEKGPEKKKGAEKFFDIADDVFTLPKEYDVRVGWMPEECSKWLADNLPTNGTPIGVYLESKKLLDALAASTGEEMRMEVEECGSIAIATEKSALIVVEDGYEGEWPPDCVKTLLEDRSVNKAGYMCKDAVLKDVDLAPILDIGDYSYTIEPPGDYTLSFPLEELVKKWVHKKFAPFDLEKVTAVLPELDQLEELIDERVRPAVHVACASLAVVIEINRKADARIRAQQDVAGMLGFEDLSNYLFNESDSD